ncbi:uncharacterized protein I303_105926 [Kwoniella dejecticola CBS 10117]|uniref:Uncharacterized protein n=1 Tax=Kwoniella dejecticola CBS 10117 TaxID=1296121 RepID=A0A1A6A0T8_9TREE|nr:uncharacterized protein I303_05949 [Kwoniella dejecticola CBS 10117]OBR83669.1 hypothetical protein I303_05949 [Kwoniella dejecticola CBS 10117]
MSTSYAAPSGPPPTAATANASANANATPTPNPDDDPFDPPPAYTPSAAQSTSGETSLAAGPSRMDFSGPPPMPDRLEQNITGVGVGFGRRPQHELGSQFDGQSSVHPQQTGHNQNYNPPPLPPRNPSTSSGFGFNAPSHPPPGKDGPQSGFGSNNNHDGAGPSRPPHQGQAQEQDLSPTEAPTPGRPLLWRGQLLVYPKGFWCHKCNNTGYKANDPSNPHETDWKKYGKPYNSALSTSYLHSTAPGSNPSASSSANFQRPLPIFAQPRHPQLHQNQHQNPYGHLPPPPGSWNSYPGNTARPPPPPPPQHHMSMSMGGVGGPPPMPGQQIYVQRGPGYIPPGALVVPPGDPRIGGRPCYNCGGSGRENDFLFGFDVGRCYTCQGLGRVFR